MELNQDHTLEWDNTVGAIKKLVRQYIYSGELGLRFDVFDKDAVEYGEGFEIDVLLAASKQNDGSTKADEHGDYPPTAMTLVFNKPTGSQYAARMNYRRVMQCVGDPAKQQEYAAELVQTLYQGWVEDKNAAVAAELKKLEDKGSETSLIEIPLGTDHAEFAASVLTQIKAKVEDLREGVTGTSYQNTAVGDHRIAARDVIIVMSNATAAMLDTYGYARVFDARYLEVSNVRRVTSSRITENTIIITDARNIQVRRSYEKLVDIQNSDGSVNYFYNKYEYITAAIASGGSYDGQVAFPFVVIKGTE